jgi:hypothetical protein
MSLLILFIIAVCLLVYAVKVSCRNKEESEKQQTAEQPTHFDLLDDNGDPIKEPKVKIVIGGGDSNAHIKELQYFCIKDKGYHVSVWPKDQGIGDYLEFPIAGITHGEHVDEHLGEFAATLEPEPTNPYDQNAIKIVTSEGHRVGYVHKDQTAYVRDFTTLPCRCYCYIGTNDGMYFTDCYITRNDQ